MKALAHLAPDGREHDLLEHLREVGRLAREHASIWGAGDHAELAGLWHDLGKYARDFQDYLRGADGTEAHVENELRGRVDHSSAGAIHAHRRGGAHANAIVFAIAGHHAGLAALPRLRERLQRKHDRHRAALEGQPRHTGPPAELLDREVPPIPSPFAPTGEDCAMRRFEMWTRMLFSALCDADFLDTERFFDPARAGQRGGGPSLDELARRLSAHLRELEASAPPTEVNTVRREVRAACERAAEEPPGVFTLTVPTGGGKTLASMAFALAHARRHGLRRIVVAIPFTSIVEQSASAYREAFGVRPGGDDDPVLEHHSSFDPRRETARSRVAAENWDAPVVVTTTVQLFESLFANRPSRCRKLHNLTRSVIVLDEAQTIPRRLLEPTLEVLEALVIHYGCTLVLCTATQPALGRSSLGTFGFERMREIVPAELRAFERLRRVRVRWPPPGTTSWPQLAEEIALEPDVLAITHRRGDARSLCEALDAVLGDRSTIHLSALMCPAHRSERIAEVKRRKRRGEPVRVVSTQLVEAGVDLDFPVVYRALGGLDALAQAAGRCNREGRLAGLGELRVYRAPTAPPPGVLEQALDVTEAMLRVHPDLDLFAPDEYRRFFEGLYRAGETDARDIQEQRKNLEYEAVATAYRLIDEEHTVLVPWGPGAELLERLRRFGPSRDLLRALQRFSINLRQSAVRPLVQAGVLLETEDGTCYVAQPGAYDERFGLKLDGSSCVDASALIVD